MLSFRKFFVFSLLFISLFPLTSNAGLYSTDYNSFSQLKKNSPTYVITDMRLLVMTV